MDKINIQLNQRTVLGILIIFSILQALYNALLPIYLDEAYYWVWALRPEFSYYDHPGMVAWIIYPFTFIANNEFTIRLSTVIAMSVTVWYLVKVSLEAFQNKGEENTAWYVFGTNSELKERRILVGGKALTTNDFDKDYFTKIDIRKTTVIPLGSKSAKLMTAHPSGTYSLLKDAKGEYTLRITNPTKFWSISKYLVIKVR